MRISFSTAPATACPGRAVGWRRASAGGGRSAIDGTNRDNLATIGVPAVGAGCPGVGDAVGRGVSVLPRPAYAGALWMMIANGRRYPWLTTRLFLS